ncbi:MAG: hypothetical protein WCB85_00530, partial [Candidatus Dormiibacterota bacterium]
MTRWGAALLLLALIPLAAGAAAPDLIGPGIVVWAVAALLVIVDSRRAPGRDRLLVTRDHDETLSVGRPNWVTVRIDLRGWSGGRLLPAA